MSDEKAGVGGVFLVQIVIELMYIIDFYRTEKGECDIEDYGTRLGENEKNLATGFSDSEREIRKFVQFGNKL